MIDSVLKNWQALQEKINQLPPAQQQFLKSRVENFSELLQALIRSYLTIVNDQKNQNIQLKLRQKTAEMIQLEAQLEEEHSLHKKANQALVKSEARLQTFLKHSADLVTILEADRRIRYHSPAIEEILGYKAEERIGKVFGELLHPDDLPRVEFYLKNLSESSGDVLMMEYRKLHKDGYWVYLEAVVKNLLDDSSINAIVINSRDITRRKQAEAGLKETSHILQALIKVSPFPIIGITREALVMVWNDAAEKVFGWSETELLGNALPGVPEEEKESFNDLLEAQFKGEVILGVPVRRIRKDGSLLELYLSTTPILDVEGKFLGSLGIFSDVTDHNKIEDALQIMEATKNLKNLFWVRYVRCDKDDSD
ncbi:PAS domain-containing protein [Ancylothrix sp. C2]|uniref:PAS domain-containing protein n=1 Tax=Ancylothrix sp. D3o TaxID=2953691 RepID=UPI0021BB185B|nr:PAS domain-containing protein [Ancylothrix sp. D3o]MCT7952338.1 PAS domain-containing protein [Ancylothrix sp. D3o]